VVALIDTSALIAAVDRADPAHDRVVSVLAAERSTIALPIVTLPEVAFLLAKRHGAAAAALAMDRLVRGPWPVTGLETQDLVRSTELMARYADSDIGFVDSAITALAERIGSSRIYTLDRRDFSILRPRHVAAFEVLPVP
jgi:predicted nucleic acid-binding protein